jgi:methylated-DNA-[protein]-cysteine S-methyltransferase
MDPKLDEPIFIKSFHSPLGKIFIKTNNSKLLSVDFNDKPDHIESTCILPGIISETQKQLDAYFKKELRSFNLPMQLEGTEFQKQVWEKLQHIEIGNTISYKHLATQIGGISKTRAVASAIARNPILIIIPCHRVIGSDGLLTGFSGGIELKGALLVHEGLNQYRKNTLF